MSPLPSPTPLRRALLRVVFSPAGLLFGFVVLLLVTCPGARGEVPSSGLGTFSSSYGSSALPDITNLQVTISRRDRPTSSVARSATPSERATSARPVYEGLQDRDARSAAVRLVPMSGPAVGVKPATRAAVR